MRSRGEERRAAKRVDQHPGRRNEVFPSGSVFDPCKCSRNAGEGDGDEFNSPRKEENETDILAGNEVADSVHLQLLPFNSSNSSHLEIGCRDVKMRREEKLQKKKKQPWKGPKNL